MHGIESVLRDFKGAGHERLIRDGIGVFNHDSAVVIGDTGHAQVIEVWLDDGVGRRT